MWLDIELNPLQIIGLGFACVAIVILAAWGFHLLTADKQVAVDDASLGAKEKKTDDTFILHKITELLGRPLKQSVLDTLGEERRISIRRRIEAAGRPNGLTVEQYAQRKAGEILLYGSLALLFLYNGQPFVSLGVLLGAVLTDLDLYGKARERQDAIQRQLPDFLDVLAVTVGAGLSFRQAIERVAAASPGVLAEEFRMTLQQMDLGTSRKDAFGQLRDRNNNDSLGKFVTAIQQAEELGAPLSQALNEIGLDMRRDDAQYMRRKAQKLNPRVTIISTATLLPGLILLLGGAMVYGLDVDWSVIGGMSG